MPNLSDWGCGDSTLPRISEVFLGRDPKLVMLFTGEFDAVKLHFVSDPTANKYGICPGAGCPLCALGGAPNDFALLPVFDIESGQVRVLRISSTRGPTSLRSALTRHLSDPEIQEKVIFLSRDGTTFAAEARPLASGANRGEREISAFLAERKEGLSLRDALWQPTAVELCELPTIRAKLDAIGGLPDAPPPSVPF